MIKVVPQLLSIHLVSSAIAQTAVVSHNVNQRKGPSTACTRHVSRICRSKSSKAFPPMTNAGSDGCRRKPQLTIQLNQKGLTPWTIQNGRTAQIETLAPKRRGMIMFTHPPTW